jgi:ATP-dependent Clp protease ATP-binding subunit ClpA
MKENKMASEVIYRKKKAVSSPVPVPGPAPSMHKATALSSKLSARVVGQPKSVDAIIPYIQMAQAGLCPPDRPLGVFMLLGPTGTGKTRTVEALAEVLHKNSKNVLRIDCGEYQMEHEVAKLIGAPPGYLGHRETNPLLNQAKLNAVMSEHNNIAILLFDEIEKAAGSLQRLLLGVLDKGSLRLGDNNLVSFERTLIFMTSNLGAKEMANTLSPAIGFKGIPKDPSSGSRLEAAAVAAVKRRFPVEFVNRIDAMITYQPLSEESLASILDMNLDYFQDHLDRRLGEQSFRVLISDEAKQFLLKTGTSKEFGARELKRVIHKHMMQPVASLVANGFTTPDCEVTFLLESTGDRMTVMVDGNEVAMAA